MKVISPNKALNLIGEQLAPTDWYAVTQDKIDQFADCTHDHQFIHVDPQRAKETPFKSTIAHGFLSLSMLSHFSESFGVMIEGFHTGINYGFDKVRFVSPVHVDKRIRCHAKIADIIEKKPSQFMITYAVEIEIEGSNKPALIAEWITMQFVK